MGEILKKALSTDDFRKTAHQLVDQLADYFEKTRQGEIPVLNWQPPEKAVAKWKQKLPNTKESPADLFTEIIEDCIHIHHPQFMGHQLSPVAPMAAVSSLLTDFLNNGTGIYEMGAAGSMMEFAVIETVSRAMGLNDEAEGFLTSGGTLANLTALLAARSYQAKDNIWKAGNGNKLALMVSAQAHYSVDRAVRIMGWGDEGIIKIPTNEKFQMDVDLLEEFHAKAIEEGREVIAVVGSACSTATGAFDDLEAIGLFCKSKKLWFHVDAAHGGALSFSGKYKHKLKGIEFANSIIMDFHKMLLTPVLSTAVIFSDKQFSYQTFAQKASYLFNKTAEEEWFNLALRTFECTKKSLAINVYTLLHTYGTDLFDEFVTQLCDLGETLAQLINDNANFELAYSPECNIVCFRYLPSKKEGVDIDVLNQNIRRKIVEDGHFYIVQTKLRGKQWLRLTLGSPFTEKEHLEGLLAEIELVAV